MKYQGTAFLSAFPTHAKDTIFNLQFSPQRHTITQFFFLPSCLYPVVGSNPMILYKCSHLILQHAWAVMEYKIFMQIQYSVILVNGLQET